MSAGRRRKPAGQGPEREENTARCEVWRREEEEVEEQKKGFRIPYLGSDAILSWGDDTG